MKLPIWMFFVEAFGCLLQPCERLKIVVVLELLLALAAGEDQFALPRCWVGLEALIHVPELDAGGNGMSGASSTAVRG